MRVRALAVAVVALASVAAAPSATATATATTTGPRTYRPPTSAAVLDPYRPPPEPWLAGNRGIEYATAPGDPVRAIGPGTVVFAGPVAGRPAVTVRHPDGLRSSYVGAGEIRVSRGEVVAVGTVVLVAAGPIHLGVRRGTAYLDPASLWGATVGGGRVRLVPDGPRPPWAAGHRSLHSPTGPPTGVSRPQLA